MKSLFDERSDQKPCWPTLTFSPDPVPERLRQLLHLTSTELIFRRHSGQQLNSMTTLSVQPRQRHRCPQPKVMVASPSMHTTHSIPSSSVEKDGLIDIREARFHGSSSPTMRVRKPELTWWGGSVRTLGPREDQAAVGVGIGGRDAFRCGTGSQRAKHFFFF